MIDLAHAAYSPIQSLFSMNADFSKLRESKFWMQKIDRFVRVQDADNSGDISRADFSRMTERYKHTIMFNPQKIELYSKLESEIFKRWNFTDESVTLSYAEFKEKLIEDLSKGETFKPFFEVVFNTLDLNDDGVISFEEWKAYYYVLGIDQAHARASFDAMDANSDGIVSKEEFINFVCEYYFTTDNKLGSAIMFGPLE